MYYENAIIVQLRFANQFHDKLSIIFNACSLFA